MSTSDRVTTPFTHDSTAGDVLSGVDLSGRRAVVTGGASGIGVETARSLARAGAEVTIAVRNHEAGTAVAEAINAELGGERVRVGFLELGDLASVRAFADDWTGPLHALVNNAGVMACPLDRTADGWELQLGTNHLGHFALARALRPALAQANGARVVSVSSSGHYRSGVDFDDPQFERRPYDRWTAYGQSKSANVLFAVEAARQWADDGIAVNALNPGGILTPLQRHGTTEDWDRWNSIETGPGFAGWKTPQQGAATSVLLAASPTVADVTGRYFDDCNEAPAWTPGSLGGVAPHAVDPTAAARLWELSVSVVGS